MRHTMTALIGACVGVALLVGGSSYANWSDASTVTGSPISTGSLDVALVAGPAWFDTSPDVYPTDPNPIVVGDFLTVPGDTIRMTQGLAVEAKGENLGATLRVAVPALSAALTGISARYTLFSVQGNVRTPVPGATNVAVGAPSTLSLAGGPGTRNYSLDIDFSFAMNAPDQKLNVIAAQLAAVDVSLNQTRP